MVSTSEPVKTGLVFSLTSPFGATEIARDEPPT
jgi:hypothetical protein